MSEEVIEFVKIKADRRSYSRRRLVHGVGINDADYKCEGTFNGTRAVCPVYRKWKDMLMRCYSKKYQSKQTTYKGCYVCKEWLTFSVFSKWYEKHNVVGYHLDKDLKKKGNKEYCPEYCLFIPHYVNSLINFKQDREYPLGVSYDKTNSKYLVVCQVEGTLKHIGRYLDLREAEVAYILVKNCEIRKSMKKYPNLAKYIENYLLTL